MGSPKTEIAPSSQPQSTEMRVPRTTPSALPALGLIQRRARTSSRRLRSHPNVPRADAAYPTSTRWTVKKSGVKSGGKPCAWMRMLQPISSLSVSS